MTRKTAGVSIEERWTPVRRETFLAALTELACVAGAERAAGVRKDSAYRLRAKDAAFREAWEAAIEEGYQKLELLLLRRATYGEHCDGNDAPQIATAFALQLLKSRKTRERRGDPELPVPMRGATSRDKLNTKLAELARRRATGR